MVFSRGRAHHRSGPAADFRERLRWLLVRDPGAEDYTEHHEAGTLEYRFTGRRREPFRFSPKVERFPELRVSRVGPLDGVAGRAIIDKRGPLVDAQRARIRERTGVW